jgi:hypothetical protein
MQTARRTRPPSKAPARLPAARPPTAVALGIATHLGWAAVVAVTPTAELLRVVTNRRIETAKPSDIAAAAPYHRAAGYEGAKRIPPPSNPRAVLERAIERQRRHTLTQIRALVSELAAGGHEVIAAAILAGRGRLGESLDKILASHSQIHVAEGLAVRESCERALAALGVPTAQIDQREVMARAAEVLDLHRDRIAAKLNDLRRDSGGPWREEQRLAALAARVSMATRAGLATPIAAPP